MVLRRKDQRQTRHKGTDPGLRTSVGDDPDLTIRTVRDLTSVANDEGAADLVECLREQNAAKGITTRDHAWLKRMVEGIHANPNFMIDDEPDDYGFLGRSHPPPAPRGPHRHLHRASVRDLTVVPRHTVRLRRGVAGSNPVCTGSA